MSRFDIGAITVLVILCIGSAPLSGQQVLHDTVILGGTIYDGSGGAPYVGDIVIDGDKITYAGPHKPVNARRVIAAAHEAVSPGFINMLSWANESLLVDGRAESDIFQGVTLEVMGEGDSMGPLTDAMATQNQTHQGDLKYAVLWRTLGQYLETLERKGISPNVASFVGAATVRNYVLGERDVQPTSAQLLEMRSLVRQAMTEGAVGLSSALIYAPGTFAKTPELIALATEAGRCGGIYITHMRSEGADLLGAIDETISIARASGAPAEIYHLKAAGRANWASLDPAIARINAARATGIHLTTDMYTYTAAATGFDAAMPHWILDGGVDAWIARLKDPATRARLINEMRHPPQGYESALAAAGPEGTLLLGFTQPALKPLQGKTLAEVARMRGSSAEDTLIDLVIEDSSRVSVAYTLMSEDNLRKEVVLPYMSFSSDEAAPAPEGVFLETVCHPRAYGSFAKLLAKYVRDEHRVSLAEAIRRLTALPASNLSLEQRGRLQAGYFADVVVFDPDKIQDHATYTNPNQLATGVRHVLVNGGVALESGKATGAPTGRFIRGQGWSGRASGGCRASAGDWKWGG